MRVAGWILAVLFVAFCALQAARPGIPEKAATAEVQAPPEIRAILTKSCYSCHSDQRRLAWFDEIVPAYWLVRADILTAREHLDFSTLGGRPAAAQKSALYEGVAMIQLAAMPLPRFVRLHPAARVSAEDLATLKAYLAPWSTPLPAAGNESREAGAQVSLTAVQPEPNGFGFDATFESWKPISTTDRGDNSTFRFILGNDIAVKAAEAGELTPWPDGARLAKIAWQQELGSDGLVHPGKFIQVELMQKDARQYKKTDGWGWGRWRGLDLQPYGRDAHFVDECTGCHLPVAGNDFVYTLPVSTARVARDEAVNDRAAAWPAGLPWQPLGWGAITMYVDRPNHATATLYGNETAMQAVRARHAAGGGAGSVHYPAGSVLALVTWAQREDPHWFGARIPDVPRSVEFVEFAPSPHYRRFGGAQFAEEQVPATMAADRTSFVIELPPAELP